MGLNESLAAAYYFEEDLRRFRKQSGRRFAAAFLTDWIRRAEASGIRAPRQMAQPPAAHRPGLLAYSAYPIGTGPLERGGLQDQDDESR